MTTTNQPSNGHEETPALLSTTWVAILLANLFRDVHEVLRPGFVEELALDGTVYGTRVTDATLLGSGVLLVFLCSTIVLARVLPRRWNRRVNVAAAMLLVGGVVATWPKDPDDLLFGAALIAGATLVVAICLRWSERSSSRSTEIDQSVAPSGTNRSATL